MEQNIVRYCILCNEWDKYLSFEQTGEDDISVSFYSDIENAYFFHKKDNCKQTIDELNNPKKSKWQYFSYDLKFDNDTLEQYNYSILEINIKYKIKE